MNTRNARITDIIRVIKMCCFVCWRCVSIAGVGVCFYSGYGVSKLMCVYLAQDAIMVTHKK